MRRIVKVAMLMALSLVIVAGAVLAGCSKGQAELQMPTIELSQYLKGTTGDFDDATINQISEPGGEMGYKFGLAAALYPTYRYTTAARDAMAVALYGSPYRIGDATSDTTYDQLTSNDKLAVDGAIFTTALTAEEQEVVATVIRGFFDRVDADMAELKTPSDTSAYVILTDSASQTAADAWASDVSDNMDYADRFFVHLVKEFVTAYPAAFEPFWAALGYTAVPASPSDAEIELVAGIAGGSSFVNGTAGAMYPTQREEQAQALYSKSYAELSTIEAPYADAAVYQDLPSVFGSDNMSDIVRLATRDGVAAGLKAYGMITADNYTAASGVEKAQIDQAVFATALPGPALERDYIDFAAVPGAILGWGAEMAAALPLQGNIAYLTLNSQVTTTAANHWVTDVESGVHPKQAFHRWLAKEGVSEMAAAGPLIQVSVQEFYFKVTNPNDYDISLDSLNMNFQVKASTTSEEVDAAKQAMADTIWVPAKEGDKDGEIIVRVIAPVKTVDVITWAIMAGKASTEAQALAGDVWGQIQAGTAKWDVTVEAKVSNKTDTQTKTYTLQWLPS